MDHDIITVTGEATYCPEDDKLRLYVGRVSRPEFDALRAEGWAVCSKQREAGKGDFAAVWTPTREDTALAYSGGYIGDEDAGPQERAADRAERFGGYRENRREDARQEADRYESGPTVFGFQDKGRGVRAADRADRCADRACSNWEKAEYWQRRTAGVISHALYVSSPGVRMGRIKKLESERRRLVEAHAERLKAWKAWDAVRNEPDADKASKLAERIANYHHEYAEFKHPRPAEASDYIREHGASLWSLLTDSRAPITGHEAAALWLERYGQPTETPSGRWLSHIDLRLEYERQMLAASGGRAGELDIEPGGFWLGGQIYKVNKSSVTGRVVSVHVRVEKVTEWTYKTRNVPGTDYALAQFDVERAKPGSYRAPTDEERAAFLAGKKAEKEKRGTVSLINPTKEDAERLQAIWNALRPNRKPATVKEYTLAEYQGRPKDWTATKEFRGVKVRVCSGMYSSVLSIVVITDRPQKPLPGSVWIDPDAVPQPTPEPAQDPEPEKTLELAAQTPADVANERARAERRAKIEEGRARRLVGRSVDTTGDLFSLDHAEAPLFATRSPAGVLS